MSGRFPRSCPCSSLKSGLIDARCVDYLPSKEAALVVERNEASMMEVEGTIGIKVSKLKSKVSTKTALTDIGLSQEGTVKILKERIQTHLDRKKKEYKDSGKKADNVNFDEELKFDLTCIQNDELNIVCCNDQLKLLCVEMIFQGFGVTD